MKTKPETDKVTTVLPDGSAFFTANIMSEDEAMKLPIKDRPICFRISSELYHAVFQAIGAASLCWKPRPSNEVFSSEEASQIAVELCFKIANETERYATAHHSVAEACVIFPNVGEYIAQLEKQLNQKQNNL